MGRETDRLFARAAAVPRPVFRNAVVTGLVPAYAQRSDVPQCLAAMRPRVIAAAFCL